MNERRTHHGRAVKRLREILYIKQDTLADSLNMSQQNVSVLEQKEVIDPELLDRIAKALNIPVETIKNFNEEMAINIIASTFNSHDNSSSVGYQSTYNINPFDKWVEAVEENKKLYERLLKEKDEKIAMLEEMRKK